MATEDLTTYTEVDPNSHITVTSARSSFAGLGLNEDAYVYKDKGVNHFDGDFEHLITVFLDEATADYSWSFYWALANLVDDQRGIRDAGGDHLGVFIQRYSSTEYRLFLQETDGGTEYTTFYVCSLDTIYYLKIKRDESVGTYGTLYCYIYSDAARTDLLHTLSLTLHSSKKDFRYIYVTQTLNSPVDRYVTGYSENLDLQEVVAKARSHGYIIG